MNKQSILLVIPNYARDFYEMPLGILYISSYLKHLGYCVHCLNLNHYDEDKLETTLAAQQYTVVATGGLLATLNPFDQSLKV